LNAVEIEEAITQLAEQPFEPENFLYAFLEAFGNLIHRVFGPAQLDIEIKDRFGNPVKPHEWFLVPLFVVNEAVERIKDGTITHYIYDPTAARLVKAES
jgi:hypothetical protein